MIDLKVYADDGSQYFLDMYETSPLKISMSIEDITTSETSSNYSRAFRVPASNHNAEFFKTAFMVEGNDFDVTQKKTAEILVNGNQFRKGHIRLQKIFVNAVTGQTDYEILFMGETRDFASIIGDAKMCELQIPSITHDFDEQAILDSWAAYPDSPLADGLSGLVNGNVIYPMIDFGNTYDDNGCVEQTRMATDHSPPAGCGQDTYFTWGQNINNVGAWGINFKRFKPMIRAKKIWDSIFDTAGFTYTSDFIGTQGDNAEVGIFKQLYVSAFGNDEDIFVDPALGSANLFEARSNRFQNDAEILEFNIDFSDPGNNYDHTTYTYTVPAGAPTSDPPVDFTFEIQVEVEAGLGGGGTTNNSDQASEYQFYFKKNGSSVGTPSICVEGQTITYSLTIPVHTGDQITAWSDFCVQNGQNGFYPIYFKCTAAAIGQFNPAQYMDCEYKQIDFIKDVLTSFKLVMQPNPNKDNDFIIEPWTNFIASGDVLDWSDKLINDKDMQIEPLFFTQTDEIDFNMEEDSDWVNTYHRQVYKENYGYLEFDSGNELLKGKREIKVNYAPTPLSVIEGDSINSAWVFPHIHTHSAEDTGNQHLPIKAKTRFLFFNGSKVSGADPTNPTPWWFDTATTLQITNTPAGGIQYYGVVSPISGQAIGSPSPTNVILQWYRDVIYYVPTNTTTWEGQSMYDIYWSNYIQSIYASFARRVTAYFVLNDLDLYDFTFDKVIFVNGTHYRVEKIIDAQVGQDNPTKVQLIKLLNYRAPADRDIAMVLEAQYSTALAACAGGTPFQTATYQGLLQVGTLVENVIVSGSSGFFKVQSNVVEPSLVGKIIEIDSGGNVLSINSVCP